MRVSIGLPLAAVVLWGSSAAADDQGLQAVLMRLNCVPARIKTSELSPAVTVYEVTCKGTSRAVTIACVDNDCRLQPKAPDEDEP